jgi:monovalent cation:H+ antiporter-2, CPA2 family
MTDLTLIRDLGCVWLAALLAGFLCTRFKQPVIAGYVLAGVAIGPHGASLINNTEQIETLAELGVALLLFVLGVEVSFRKVFSSAKRVFAAGLGQLIITMICAWIFAYLAGLIIEPDDGFIFGSICALSSTVVASKLLSERGEADSAHGKVLVAILLVQDISLVPIIALLPALNPATGLGMSSLSSFLPALLMALSKAALLVALILLGATKVVPYLLKWVTRTNSREVFLLSLITLCISIALSSQQLGLSLALGAFLAGAMVSESPYGHQALADLLPVKDLFSTVFFVSVGMLLNPAYITQHPIQVLSFVLLLLVGKAAIGALCARVAINSWWSAIIVGVGLAQIGEFSFVLATVAHSLQFLPQDVYELFLAGAVITLIISPLLMSTVPKLLWRYALIKSEVDKGDEGQKLSGHVIICGYGRIGRNVGIALNSLSIPLVVIDINSETIEELEKEGVPCIYGDVFGRQVLMKAGLNTAAALVLTVPDPTAAMTIIAFIRHQNQDIKIIARAHRSDDIEIFRAIGANAVVQPEFESSIEITRLALLSLTADHSTIEKALFEIETERYKIFQHDLPGIPRLSTTNETESFSGNWFAINKLDGAQDKLTIGSLDIRNKTGATILAIKRSNQTIAHPTPDEAICEGDALYVAGNPEQLQAFETLIKASRFCPNI